MSAVRNMEQSDYRFSFYSLARCDGGVSIDMTDGRVSFDWSYVPFGEIPAAVATYVRRLHFRNGQFVDEPAREILVPPRVL
jgi:hypothetical protein